jgi:hypothetical protein
MLTRGAAVMVLLLVLAGCGGGNGDGGNGGGATETTDAVAEQLKYLPREASSIVAVDLRWEGRNWKHLRDHAQGALDAYGAEALKRDGFQPSLDDNLDAIAKELSLSFADDIRPLLDGHLVVGTIEPPRPAAGSEPTLSTFIVFRTRGDGLRGILERLYTFDLGAKPRPHPDHEDVTLFGETAALIGDDTVLSVDGERGERLLEQALDRAESGDGAGADRLADAERRTELDDPFVLATADRSALNALVTAPELERAQGEVPYLDAIRAFTGAVRLDEEGAELGGVIATDPDGLEGADLPVAPPGDLELPRGDAITGASRDQSYTTTFLSRTARALFADSDFAKAVKAAEDDLGVTFEEEVLRQFSCPSMSEFTPASQRFGARSCVKDPERMRELLPRLSKHLPRIITGLQGLENEGLIALLLIAPDAPLVPGFSLAQIQVNPPKDPAAPDEVLYEITGLRDNTDSTAAQAGPEKIVFGMIGDAFVVASDHELARRAAELEGEKLDEPAASAAHLPLARLLLAGEGPDERTGDASAALYDFLGTLDVTASADRDELRATGRLDLGD